MANDFTSSLRNAAASVDKYVDEAATIDMITEYVEVSSDADSEFEAANPGARTIIKLDSDS